MDLPDRRLVLKAAVMGGSLLATSRLSAGEPVGKKIGIIGCGNRAKTLVPHLVNMGATIAAIADVAAFRVESLISLLPEAQQKTLFKTSESAKLLENKALDAVVLALPEHQHKDHLLAALRSGKDIYTERPLAKSIDEGFEILDAAKKTKCIVQTGFQRRSSPAWDEAAKCIKDKAFGKLISVRAWDSRRLPVDEPKGMPSVKSLDWDAFLGTAKKRDFDAARYFDWRWYWDTAGGPFTDMGVDLLDLVSFASGVEIPKSVVAHGGRYHFLEHETPDVVHGIWDYGSFCAAISFGQTSAGDGTGAIFQGTKRTLVADLEQSLKLYDTVDRITPERKPVKEWKVTPGQETEAHLKNWLDCLKTREEPAATLDLANKSTLAAHLANLSYRTGKRIFWDAERKEVIGG